MCQIESDNVASVNSLPMPQIACSMLTALGCQILHLIYVHKDCVEN